MVQITTVRQIQDDGSSKIISAKDFDKGEDFNKPCLCPDPNCHAEMSHVEGHSHTYLGESSTAYQLEIHPYFRRHVKSPPHDTGCKIYAQKLWLEQLGRERYAAGMTSVTPADGARRVGLLFNLNVRTSHTSHAPLRAQTLAAHFSKGQIAPSIAKAFDAHHPKPRPEPLSYGLRTIKDLAQILDNTAFDAGMRGMIHFRKGPIVLPLEKMFYDSPLALFRQEHARAKEGHTAMPVLAQFKPIKTGEFRSNTDLTITGRAERARGIDGQDYYPSIKIKFTDEDLYKKTVDTMRAERAPSFLIYGQAHVDLEEFRQNKTDIHSRAAKHNGVFVHVKIENSDQIMAWAPRSAQMDLTEKMHLPEQEKPHISKPAPAPKSPDTRQLDLF